MPSKTNSMANSHSGTFAMVAGCIDGIEHREVSTQEPANKEVNSEPVDWWVTIPEVDQPRLVDLIPDGVVVLRPTEAANDLTEAIRGRSSEVKVSAEIHPEAGSDREIARIPG